ncbi:MAG: hypothetical protein ABI476_04180, partial [Oxalobacteraceae bacterium]
MVNAISMPLFKKYICQRVRKTHKLMHITRLRTGSHSRTFIDRPINAGLRHGGPALLIHQENKMNQKTRFHWDDPL